MGDSTKDFAPISGDYDFFLNHSDEAKVDLDAYASHLRVLGPGPGTIRLLDFGCGPGDFTGRFLDRAGWPADRVRLSLVEPVVAYLRRASEQLGPRSAGTPGAWTSLPAEAVRQFDLILSNHVLYYVRDLDATLAALIRALDAGGTLLATMAGRDNALVRIWYDAFGRLGWPVPYRTAEDLESGLRGLGAGFERHEVRYRVEFPDDERNRLAMLRFLLGEHLEALPRGDALALLDRHAECGRVAIATRHNHYFVRPST